MSPSSNAVEPQRHDGVTHIPTLPTCVCPPVSLQLVAPREPLATEDPVTHKRPLAGVPAQVGPQVGRLAVNLPAALHMADVLLLLRGVAAVPATQLGVSWRWTQ